MRTLCTTLGGILLVGLLSSAYAQTLPAADSSRPKTYTYIEKMPVFPVLTPGDSAVPTNQRFMRFLNADVQYPPKALRDGISGKVYFSFDVNSQGWVQNIKLAKGLRDDMDAEVLRNAHRLDAIQWEPGTQNGRPVTVSFTVPIFFSINGKSSGQPLGDSLDTGPYQRQLAFPLSSWDSKRWQAPKGRGMKFWGPYRMYFENLRKPVTPSPAGPLRAIRYQFTVESGKVHYVGTWNLANENQPAFLDEKYLIDPAIQAYFPQFNFKEAVVALPR